MLNTVKSSLTTSNIIGNSILESFVSVEGDVYNIPLSDMTVKISNLSVGNYLVTQNDWKKVMGYDPSTFNGHNLPVENVSWIEALEFCNKVSEKYGLTPVYKLENGNLVGIVEKDKNVISADSNDFSKTEGFRLPTVSEWEWFARGGKKSKLTGNFNSRYSGGNDVLECSWGIKNSSKSTKEVGLKKSNDLGIYDLSGNVWEWCFDSYSSNDDTKFLKGGSWFVDSKFLEITSCFYAGSSDKNSTIGLRICRTL